jgi:hypothetical protein
MNRKWEKISENTYQFTLDHDNIGEMEIQINSIDTKATCHMNDTKFTIRRTGFWKNSIEISDNKDQIIAKAYSEKWYAHYLVLEFGDQKFKLILHNNPMAEYSILDERKNILAYGLAVEDGSVHIRVTCEEIRDYLFDYLLWYLFVPIASENMGSDFRFKMQHAA